ncbi:hypothetical protein [Virgibacillus doumboii]|uniref:hypothetical protein n=1 Tax=Virgibacillus doumboii TaxID=2697503 RepID=UPI0013DFEDFA|nr:hypothetical protein [Virgibacillus doumboii]
MGLFINKNKHPDVFRNDGEILEPNQGYFRYDHFSEMINEQKKINRALSDSFHNLKALQHKQNNTQANRWRDVSRQLHSLNETKVKHEQFENQAIEWLQTLDKNNRKLQQIAENEDQTNQRIMNEINALQQSNGEVFSKLEEYESTGEQLTEQVNELIDFNKQLTERIDGQDHQQKNVLDRLENQEALMEKTLRQLDHFRSILFERTSHLSEKIESSYDLTSSYVYKLMTGSDRPLTLYMDQKKVENKKPSD